MNSRRPREGRYYPMTSVALPQEPGVHRVTLADRRKSLTISIPGELDIPGGIPCILALHYGGPPYPFKGGVFLESLILPALGSRDRIVLAPDEPGDRWEGEAGEDLCLELVDAVRDSYAVRNLPVMVGYSIGGIGTWRIGSRNQDFFSGLLPISAPVPEIAQETDWYTPVLAIHSRSDEHFSVHHTRTAVEALQKLGAPVKLLEVDGLTHFDVEGFVTPLRDVIPWIRNLLHK